MCISIDLHGLDFEQYLAILTIWVFCEHVIKTFSKHVIEMELKLCSPKI